MSHNVKFFSRVGKTRIIPIGLKMLIIFICLILLSNFITNFISLQLSQKQIITLNNTIMVDKLKELYNTSSNQYQIYAYSGNLDESNEAMIKVARTGFSNPNSVAFGLTEDGKFNFFANVIILHSDRFFSLILVVSVIHKNWRKRVVLNLDRDYSILGLLLSTLFIYLQSSQAACASAAASASSSRLANML